MQQASSSLGAQNEHVGRLKKRIQILKNEIQEIEGGMAGEEEAQPEPQPQPAARAQPASQPVEESKGGQLSEQSLKILGLLQTKRKEYMDGINYAQSTLKD